MSETSWYDDDFAKPAANQSEEHELFPDEPVIETPISKEEETLLTRGYFTSTVDLGNNEVVLRTLKLGEELEAAIVADRYGETIEAGRALATALVAASIVSVNGKPLIRDPLGRADETLEARFNYITSNWYWLTVRTLHEEYNRLLNKVFDSFSEIKKE